MHTDSHGTDTHDRRESVAATWALVGATVALAAAVFFTLRSFALQELGDGLLWFFVFGPLLVAAAYWAGMVGAWVLWRTFHRHH